MFRHALVRDAVEDQLLGRERRRLHEAALAALARVAGAPTSPGSRSTRWAPVTTTSSSTSRRRAPRTTSSGARPTRRLRLATDALTEDPTASRCSRPRRGRRGSWVSTTKRSVSHGDGASVPKRVVTSSDKPRPPTWWRGIVWDLGRGSTSTTLRSADLERLAGQLPEGPQRAQAYAAVAQAHMLAHRSALAVEWSDRAIEEAERWDAKPVRALAMVEKGSALAGWAGHRGRGVRDDSRGHRRGRRGRRPRRWSPGASTTCSGASRSTPRRGRRSSPRSTLAAERAGYDAMIRTKHADLAGRDRDQRGRHGEGAGRSRQLGAARRRGHAERGAMAGAQPGLGLARGRAHGRGRCARRSSRRPRRAPTIRGRSPSPCSSPERAGHRDEVEPLLRRFATRRRPSSTPANVEWTVMPIDAALRAGVAPAVVREVLGPMHELARGKPWFPFGEAILLAAEGEHGEALEQLGLPCSPIPSLSSPSTRSRRRGSPQRDATSRSVSAS